MKPSSARAPNSWPRNSNTRKCGALESLKMAESSEIDARRNCKRAGLSGCDVGSMFLVEFAMRLHDGLSLGTFLGVPAPLALLPFGNGDRGHFIENGERVADRRPRLRRRSFAPCREVHRWIVGCAEPDATFRGRSAHGWLDLVEFSELCIRLRMWGQGSRASVVQSESGHPGVARAGCQQDVVPAEDSWNRRFSRITRPRSSRESLPRPSCPSNALIQFQTRWAGTVRVQPRLSAVCAAERGRRERMYRPPVDLFQKGACGCDKVIEQAPRVCLASRSAKRSRTYVAQNVGVSRNCGFGQTQVGKNGVDAESPPAARGRRVG